MKILKFLALINLLLILFQGVNYYSLKVSEKYETQLEGFIELDTKALNEIENKKKEINDEIFNLKRRTIILVLILIVLIISIYFFRSSYSTNKNEKILNKQ